jgi:hypothetical protein
MIDHLNNSEAKSMVKMFQKAGQDELQHTIPKKIPKSTTKLLNLVRKNYRKYFVEFTEQQNEYNKQFCVKFDINDSRNMYNTDAFFLFKDVYGDGNCAFYCLMESGLLNKAFESGISNTAFESVLKKNTKYQQLKKKPTVLQYRFLLGQAFNFLYFTQKSTMFRRLVHLFLATDCGILFGFDREDLGMRSRHPSTEYVIKRCFTEIEQHGVFVDSKSFFSCAAFALNYFIMDDEDARFVIMNSSPHEYVAKPYDTMSLENELMKQQYMVFDDWSDDILTLHFELISEIFHCSNQKINDYSCKNTYHFFLHESGRPFEDRENLCHYLFMKRINHEDNFNKSHSPNVRSSQQYKRTQQYMRSYIHKNKYILKSLIYLDKTIIAYMIFAYMIFAIPARYIFLFQVSNLI